MKQNINCFLRPGKDVKSGVDGVLFEMDIILLKKSRGDGCEADGIITFTKPTMTISHVNRFKMYFIVSFLFIVWYNMYQNVGQFKNRHHLRGQTESVCSMR